MNTSSELKGLAPEHLKTAYGRNWFRLFVKKEFGGEEATLTEAMQALFDAAEIDGSLGWCVNLGSGASYFSGFLSPLAVKELLGDPKSVFAGSGQIGTAKKLGTTTRSLGTGHDAQVVLMPPHLPLMPNWMKALFSHLLSQKRM